MGYQELQIRCVKSTSIDSTCIISSPNPMFDYLLESSQWDNSNKWSNIGFDEEMGILEIKIRALSGALHFIIKGFLKFNPSYGCAVMNNLIS